MPIVNDQVSVNDTRLAPLAQRPRGAIYIDGGQVLPSFGEFSVTNNTYFAADKFRVVMSLDKMPLGYGLPYWASASEIPIEIRAGFLPPDAPPTTSADTDSLFVGNVEDVDINLRTREITCTGRDLTSRFIDSQTTEKYPDNTSSQIAELLAKRHGLDSVVVPTTTRVGTYYELEHARLAREITEWDLLTALAQEEGFDVYVEGRTLYFIPPVPESTTPYLLLYQPPTPELIATGNFIDVNLRRNVNLAKDITIKIKTWNQEQEDGVIVTIRAQNAKKTQHAGGIGQVYSYTFPNLTRDQALKKGQAILRELTLHEKVIDAKLTAQPTSLVNMRSVFRLSGTGSDFDQVYFPDAVTRVMTGGDRAASYRMSVRMKNHSPQSTVIV